MQRSPLRPPLHLSLRPSCCGPRVIKRSTFVIDTEWLYLYMIHKYSPFYPAIQGMYAETA